jgi:hypothetical protein
MVWFFRRTFCKKNLYSLINYPAVQLLVNIAGQYFSVSLAPDPLAPDSIPPDGAWLP